ncbi:hypothetical protein ACKFKF_30145 [Phormidesmis sp. 146-12]
MQWNAALLSVGVAILSVLPAVSASAASIEMRVLDAIDAQGSNGRCPEKVVLTEASRPYREGGYTIDGSANLSAIVEKVAIAATDDFSVTWVGKLKPQYSKCRATASMAKVGGAAYQGHSYLRMRFVGGKAYLILDMTGMSDANDSTTVILNKSVKNGNPNWTWGGTD